MAFPNSPQLSDTYDNYIWNGEAWMYEDPDEYGMSSSKPGASALDILQKNPSANINGLYWIKPESYSGSPFQAYCDMTTDGGGWTTIAIEFSYSNYILASGTEVDINGKNWNSAPLMTGTGNNYFWAIPKIKPPIKSFTEMLASKLNTANVEDLASTTTIIISNVIDQWNIHKSLDSTRCYSNGWCTAHWFGDDNNKFEWWNYGGDDCSDYGTLSNGFAPRRIYKNGSQIAWNGDADTGTATVNNFGIIMVR